MSSVMRPQGRLPQRVYWVRRLFALFVVVLVITLLWWLAGRLLGNADGSEGSSDTPAPPSSSDPSGQLDPTTDTDGRQQGMNGHRGGNHQRPGHQRPLTPTGPCQAEDVAMAVRVDDARAGATSPVILTFKSRTTTACTLSITPSTLALRITSGNDAIWSSDDCPDDLQARQLVVQPSRPLSTYTFVWDGRRSTDECTVPGKVAVAGGYYAEAALIGADAHSAYFDLT